jgi:T5SS/PEP-CTERM-associated repeat protein
MKMKRRCCLAGIMFIYFAAGPGIRAQYAANFQTNTISAVTNNWGGDYVVGSNTFADALLIQIGGALNNANGYLGYTSGSSNNSAVIAGPRSAWNNANRLYVGNSGAANSLVISNGGYGQCSGGYVGYNAGSSNNTVLITDTNSLWQGNLSIGYNGSGNTLVISNGGRVSLGSVFAGYNTSSGNNSVRVTGPGSFLNSFAYGILGGLNIGFSGAGNRLVIENGGLVSNVDAYVGYDIYSSNNNVLVTGTGSVWSCSDGLYVGYQGSGNSLVISNGGKVVSMGIANNVGWMGNRNSAVVTGPGSIWTNFLVLFLGQNDNGYSLTIGNGGQVADINGVIYGGHSSVLVTDPGSAWNNSGSLSIYSSPYGQRGTLIISNGGFVVNNYGFVGYGANNTNETVRVVNDGVWQNKILYMGYQGPSNLLVVGGGTVLATNLTVGFASAGCDNIVELDSGRVVVTNATHDAVLEVRNGQFILNDGVLQVDVLVMTNACARFVRNGGTLIVGTLVLDPNLSAVGDGIPNGWKQQYGLDPFDPNLSTEDADGDGMSNLQEYLAGSNPVADIKAITREGNDIRVTWGAALGKTNALQATMGDVDGSYSNNFADIFVVNGSVITNYLDVGAATNSPSRYYRVRLVP